MTAETLKPFITPTSAVNNFPAKHSGVTHSKRKIKHLIPIVLSVIAAALVIGILSLTIWQTKRVQTLETDLNGLKRDMENLRQRLGIHYLEDMAEFQKEYNHMLIDDPTKVDALEGGNDDDDEDNDDNDDDDYNNDKKDDYDDDSYDYENDKSNEDDNPSTYTDDDETEVTELADYLDYINKESKNNQTNLSKNNNETETEATASSVSASTSNEDNVFEDFTSYSESKKKKQQRKSRSIADIRNELQSNDVSQNQSQVKTEQHLKESGATTESHLPHHHLHKSHSRSRQGRRRLLVRKGESPVSAKSADYQSGNVRRQIGNSGTPAVHFHVHDRVAHRNAPSIPGSGRDMFLGHPTPNMGHQWEEHFRLDDGVLTVNQGGLYYVYAQIGYSNNHDENGFIIYHENKEFLQCLNTVPTNMLKVHTCHTSGLIYLKNNESIHLRDIHENRTVSLRKESNRSYFGIIKI